MSNFQYKAEDLDLSIFGEKCKGFWIEKGIIHSSIPPLDITLDLPDNRKTGVSINLNELVKYLCKTYPEQMKDLVKELK